MKYLTAADGQFRGAAGATSSAAVIRPAFCSIDSWCLISGMGRRATYEALGSGQLRAVKRGTSTLVDVDHGLEWVRSLPPAKIRPMKPKGKNAESAVLKNAEGGNEGA